MTVLPDHVKKIVAEIETEIGEEPGDAAAAIEGAALRGPRRQRTGRGRRARDPDRDRRGSRSRRAWSARPAASTGCTPS